MTIELYWLILTTLMTSLMWLPYILNRIMTRGLMPALKSGPADSPHSAWAERAILAHKNAVENLVVFAPLVIATHILGMGTSLTAQMCMVYFIARLAHYIIYTAGIAVLRTLIFAVSFLAQLILALNLLGVM
ncbi:MAG: MAPEG family protein [Emcibacteraceae bacterium]|nr:MAPEG family protein [Emcibacteraceae bacterium]MDG1727449.1 MAPEG family protein [Emcibacteraceae bacterium]